MKHPRLLFLGLALLLIAVVVGGTQIWTSKRNSVAEAQQTAPEPGTLAYLAQQAQASGSTYVEVPAPIEIHEEFNNLDDVFSKYNLIVADLVDKRTYDDATADYIYTWYKFRIVEVLNPQVNAQCPDCPKPPAPPPGMLPLQQNEFLAVSYFGSAVVNGVQMLGYEPFVTDFQTQLSPSLGYNNRYLLTVRIFPSQVGKFAAGKTLNYAVSSTGALNSLYDMQLPLKDEFAARYHNNLNEVRVAFGAPPAPSQCDPALQQACADQDGIWNSSTCTCSPGFDPCLRKPWLCE